MKIANLRVHPAAHIFPMMPEGELEELAKDIKANGLVHPIIIHESQILDGRNRLAACLKACVAPKFADWTGNGSPTTWVLSVNLHRRHLTPGQRAAIATDALPMFEAEAAQRRKDLSGTRSNPGERREVQEIIPEPEKQSRDKAASAVGVNPRYVSDAKAIKEKSPEVFEKVKSGELTIPEAKKKMALPTVSFSADAESAGEDSYPLYNLKKWWKKAGKKDRAEFLRWIETQQK